MQKVLFICKIIHLVRMQNFPKNWNFLPPDTQNVKFLGKIFQKTTIYYSLIRTFYMRVSRGKKC